MTDSVSTAGLSRSHVEPVSSQLWNAAVHGDIELFRQLLPSMNASGLSDAALQSLPPIGEHAPPYLAALLNFCFDTSPNSEDRTPLHVLAMLGFDDVLQALLDELGGSLSSVFDVGAIETVFSRLLHSRDQYGYTALQLAMAYNEGKVARTLLEFGADGPCQNVSMEMAFGLARDDPDVNPNRFLATGENPPSQATCPGENAREVEAQKLRPELPNEPDTLKNMIIDCLSFSTTFEQRFRSTFQHVLGEKYNVLNTCRLYERAMSVKDPSTAHHFLDQIANLEEENSQQQSSIFSLKHRIKALERELLRKENEYHAGIMKITQISQGKYRNLLRRYMDLQKMKAPSQYYDYFGFELPLETSTNLEELEQMERPLTADEGGLDSSSGEVDLEAERLPVLEHQLQQLQLMARDMAQLQGELEQEVTASKDNVGKIRRFLAKQERNQINSLREEFDSEAESAVQAIYGYLDPGTKRQRVIKAATKETLIRKMLDVGTSQDETFHKVFLLSFPEFCSADEFMEATILMYKRLLEPPEPPNSSSSLRQTVADREDHNADAGISRAFLRRKAFMRLDKVLEDWILQYWKRDFQKSEKRMTKMKEFLMPVLEEQLPNARRAHNFQHLCDNPEDLLAYRVLLPEGPSDDASSITSIMDIACSEVEVAQQITLLEFDIYRKIETEELITIAWMKEDKDERAPGVTAMTRWSNHVVQLVVSEIIKKHSLKKRVAVMEKIIRIAEELKKLNNFNGVQEFVAGLLSSPVHRLNRTKAQLSRTAREALQDLSNLTAAEMNFKALRAQIRAAKPPCIPFLGTYMSDLVFLDTFSSKRSDSLINFSRYHQMGNCIEELRTFQSKPYENIQPNKPLLHFLRSYDALSQETAYNQSLSCEPRPLALANDSIMKRISNANR